MIAAQKAPVPRPGHLTNLPAHVLLALANVSGTPQPSGTPQCRSAGNQSGPSHSFPAVRREKHNQGPEERCGAFPPRRLLLRCLQSGCSDWVQVYQIVSGGEFGLPSADQTGSPLICIGELVRRLSGCCLLCCIKGKIRVTGSWPFHVLGVPRNTKFLVMLHPKQNNKDTKIKTTIHTQRRRRRQCCQCLKVWLMDSGPWCLCSAGCIPTQTHVFICVPYDVRRWIASIFLYVEA